MRISDWSSDVCSSDLGNVTSATDPSGATHSWVYDESSRVISETDAAGAVTTYGYVGDSRVPTTATDAVGGEIGRASCRERVCQSRVDLGGRRIIKKKKQQTTE